MIQSLDTNFIMIINLQRKTNCRFTHVKVALTCKGF